MRVWTNKKTGKRYYKGDHSPIAYRRGRVIHSRSGSVNGYNKFRNKKTGHKYDSMWAGH